MLAPHTRVLLVDEGWKDTVLVWPGEQVRVLSKSKDELQSAIAFLKGKDFGVDLQFTNYR